MSILHIFIPETGLGASCDWALREAGRTRSGTSPWADVPQAQQVILIVAASRVLLTRLNLPAVSQTKLREMLAFAVEDKLLAEPEKIHAVAAARSPSGETDIAVIDKAWLRQQLENLQQHGIHADEMRVETLLPRLEKNTWSLVWNGRGGFVRTGKNSGIVVDGGDTRTPPLALTLALDEARAAQAAPEGILLYHAEGASAPTWNESFNLNSVQRGSWTWQSSVESDDRSGLNLLQGEFAPPSKGQAWIKQLRPALPVLGIIVALHLVASLGDWARLRHEKNRLQNDMVATFKQTFPEATAVVDPALQMRRNLSGLRRTRGVADSADLLPLLAAAAPLMRQGKVLTLQYEQDKLQFDLLLQDSAQLATLRAQLPNLPLRAELGAPNTLPSGIKVQLTIGIEFAPRVNRL